MRRAPQPPRDQEPEDIVIDSLSTRYVMSTIANLAALHSFQARKGESKESFFSRFNGIVRNIEEEEHLARTTEQIRTLF